MIARLLGSRLLRDDISGLLERGERSESKVVAFLFLRVEFAFELSSPLNRFTSDDICFVGQAKSPLKYRGADSIPGGYRRRRHELTHKPSRCISASRETMRLNCC